jgi:quercetin dioxygenase-like cupin family protein
MESIKLQIQELICKISSKKEPDYETLVKLIHILKNVDEVINPKCKLGKLSNETNGFTKINGEKIKGELAPLEDSITLLNIKNAQGKYVKIMKGVRKANTRVGIHVHKYGGYTIILKGEMTDYVQGLPVKKYKANSGYYMPPCTPMSASNEGPEDVELIDIFIGDPEKPYIQILEPGWKWSRYGVFDS